MKEILLSNDSSAYDLDKFQPHHSAKRKPRLTVKRPGQQAKARARLLFTLKASAFVAVIVAAVVAMLYNRAVLTELNTQISVANKALSEEKSDYTRLTAELEAKISLRNVEEYATQKLGMMPVDKSQIVYLDLNEDDRIELTEASPRRSLTDEIRLAIHNVQAYISTEENTHIKQQDKQEG